jgi:acetylornithine deacetylase/succinyl-diaminopimelate desuccinylase-like protein
MHPLRLLPALLCLAAIAPTVSARAQDPFRLTVPAPEGFDRSAAQRATLAHLEALIRIDTRNPPGNELHAARYFEAVFRDVPGVETTLYESAPGRGHVVARLRAARPTARPLVVLGHMDVVGADSSRWETPPLEPTVRDGYLYGRGAIDNKGMLAAMTTAFVELARRRDRLDRDVIFLGTAAEEGGPGLGIDWLMQHHAGALGDPEFALNEGGRILLSDGAVRSVQIQTVEKISYNVQAVASGPSGHGSVPIPDNALAALARAVARVHDWRAPVGLNETTRLYFAGLALTESDPRVREAMERIAGATDPAEIEPAAAVLSEDPRYNAVLRAGASLTLMQGGIRSNVIPSEGTATFNVRILPGEDPHEILRMMEAAADEPQVSFRLLTALKRATPASPVDNGLYRALEQVALEMAPGAVVKPVMSTGATDATVLRQHGIPTYGILPMPMTAEDEARMHGDDERVPVDALGWGAEYVFRVLLRVASR